MPAEERRDEPAPLVDSDDLSRELVQLCHRFTDDLFEWMDRALVSAPEPHHASLKVAVSQVAFALTDRLLYPTYRHHVTLIPIDLRPASR